MNEVTTVYGVGSSTPKTMAEQVASAWNQQHGNMIASNQSTVGLGGLLRPNHAAALLKEKGHEIRAKRALELPPPHPTSQPPSVANQQQPNKRRCLELGDVASLSHKDIIPWLKAVGLAAYSGSLDSRRQRLVDYFSTKPDGHKIEL